MDQIPHQEESLGRGKCKNFMYESGRGYTFDPDTGDWTPISDEEQAALEKAQREGKIAEPEEAPPETGYAAAEARRRDLAERLSQQACAAMGVPNPNEPEPAEQVMTSDHVEFNEDEFIHPDDVPLAEALGDLCNDTWAAMQTFLAASPCTVTGISYVLDLERTNTILCKHLGIEPEKDLCFSIICMVDGNEGDDNELRSSMGYFYKGEKFIPQYVKEDDPRCMTTFHEMPSLKELLSLAVEHDTATPYFFGEFITPPDEDTEMFSVIPEDGKPIVPIQVQIFTDTDDLHPQGHIEPAEFPYGTPDAWHCEPVPGFTDVEFTDENPCDCIAEYDNVTGQFSIVQEPDAPYTYQLAQVVRYYTTIKSRRVSVHFSTQCTKAREFAVGDYPMPENFDLVLIERAQVFDMDTDDYLDAAVAVDTTHNTFSLVSKREDTSFWTVEQKVLHVTPELTHVNVHLWVEPVPNRTKVGDDFSLQEYPIPLNFNHVWHMCCVKEDEVIVAEPIGGRLPNAMEVPVALDPNNDAIVFPHGDGVADGIFIHVQKKIELPN